jgi:hypothetical protein
LKGWVGEGEFFLAACEKFSPRLGQQPGFSGQCKLAGYCRGCSHLGMCVGQLVPAGTTAGGQPHGGDRPDLELEFSDDFQCPSRIFVVVFVELKGVNGSQIVDTDEYSRAWQGGGEESGDCSLYGNEFGFEELSPAARHRLSVNRWSSWSPQWKIANLQPTAQLVSLELSVYIVIVWSGSVCSHFSWRCCGRVVLSGFGEVVFAIPSMVIVAVLSSNMPSTRCLLRLDSRCSPGRLAWLFGWSHEWSRAW